MLTSDKPLAAAGLTSYRYDGPYGWIMIGACDVVEALAEARRSTDGPVLRGRLQVWRDGAYCAV